MSKGDNQRPAAIPEKEVIANFDRLGMLGTRTKSPEDGSCGHQRRVLRAGLFHCLDCLYVQPESERIVFEEMDHPRTCARCGNPRAKGVNSCQQPCGESVDPLEEAVVEAARKTYRETTSYWAPELRGSEDHAERLGEKVGFAVAQAWSGNAN